MTHSLSKLCWLLGLLMVTTPAAADDYHYINLLVGNRASGLAGAYTALSDDPAGCFYNPAGIAFAPHNSLSASVNAFNTETKTYQDAMQRVSGDGISWRQESSILLPNFFGMVKKIGAHTIGASYAVTNSTLRRQDQTFTDLRSTLADNPIEQLDINIDDSDRTYLFGPSYAYRFSNHFSIGTTLYLYYRDLKRIRNQLLRFEQGEHYLSNYYSTKEQWGLKPSLGIMWEPADKLSVGLNFSKIYLSNSHSDDQLILRDTTNQVDDFSDTNLISVANSESDEQQDFPLETSLGAAYFVSPQLLFSADIRYYEDVRNRDALINVAVGTEYYLNEKLALRGGFWSDLANTPQLSRDKVNQAEHIDLYGGSISLTLFHRKSSVSLGCNYSFGNGDAQVVSNSTSIQDVEVRTTTIYISAGYSF